MRKGIDITVSAANSEQLAAVVVDRNSPQKHVWRARIILATAESCGTAEVMRRAGVSKPCVWRWQERFMREVTPSTMNTSCTWRSKISIHTRTKARSPQTNGICERFHKTVLDEFYRIAFRKRIYATIEQLQGDLDACLTEYNQVRSHQGRWCTAKPRCRPSLTLCRSPRRRASGRVTTDNLLLSDVSDEPWPPHLVRLVASSR